MFAATCIVLYALMCDYADINECATNSAGCSAEAICTNTVGSFTCNCPSGYTGDGFTCARKWL